MRYWCISILASIAVCVIFASVVFSIGIPSKGFGVSQVNGAPSDLSGGAHASRNHSGSDEPQHDRGRSRSTDVFAIEADEDDNGGIGAATSTKVVAAAIQAEGCCPWGSAYESREPDGSCPNATHPRCKGAAATPVPKYSDKLRPLFYMKHLTKAGGTYGGFLMDTVIKKTNWRVNRDDGEMGKHNKKSHFVVVTMRNPCDLYVSFANYNPNKAYGYGIETMGANPVLGRPVGQLSVSEFEKWMLNARSPHGFGFYSFYFWQSVIRPECHNFWRLPTDKRTWKTARCENISRVIDDLKEWSPTTLAHCWVFQETLIDDFRVCLKAYEQTSGYAAGSIDWELFERIASNKTLSDLMFLRSSLHGDTKGKLPQTSSLRHKSCKEYFASQELQDAMRKADFALFDKLGYRTCCGKSDHIIE